MADKLIQLEQMLQEQQAELISLREALAHKQANRPARPAHALPATPVGPASPAPTVTAAPAPVQLKTPDTSRRKMLKRMGLAVLAGGAALGVTAATYAPAEARISVNPTAKIGAVITRTGASITNISTNPNLGLLASPDDSIDASTAGILNQLSSIGISGITASGSNISTGVYGFSNVGYGVYGTSTSGYGVVGSSDSNTGMYGTSTSGYGVFGSSFSSNGVVGNSTNGTGVNGQTNIATSPAIVANNIASTSGIALRIEQGGLSVTGAGIGTQTAAFVHQTTAGNISGTATKIDNPLCNSRPDALLFVTPNVTPKGLTGITENKIVGVFYLVNLGFWYIYHQDGSSPVAGVYFNVLIINP